MTCKGICIRHKAQKPVCEIFLKWDGLWCPCCGYRLRTKPRNLKYKAKLRARKKIEEYQLSLQQQYLPAKRAHKKRLHQDRRTSWRIY